jgi:predicted AAA+ superfamily ATPase
MVGENMQKFRVLSSYLPSSNKRRLVVLTGARQTGKTTLAKATYPELRYINLDAPENREMLRKISTPSWALTIGNAVIDEAQKEPSVFEKIKYTFDERGDIIYVDLRVKPDTSLKENQRVISWTRCNI